MYYNPRPSYTVHNVSPSTEPSPVHRPSVPLPTYVYPNELWGRVTGYPSFVVWVQTVGGPNRVTKNIEVTSGPKKTFGPVLTSSRPTPIPSLYQTDPEAVV